MLCQVTLRHEDGREVVLTTALDDRFLERLYPAWRVAARVVV